MTFRFFFAGMEAPLARKHRRFNRSILRHFGVRSERFEARRFSSSSRCHLGKTANFITITIHFISTLEALPCRRFGDLVIEEWNAADTICVG
jgi:hypothetical protein